MQFLPPLTAGTWVEPVGGTLLINRNAVAERMSSVCQGRGKEWILRLHWPKKWNSQTISAWREIKPWSPSSPGRKGRVHPSPLSQASGVPSGAAGLRVLWRALARRGGGGEVVAGCSPGKSHFPTSDPRRSLAFPQVTPWLAGAAGQLRGYLYWLSNSCQGGGKDYSATSSELLAEQEHKCPVKGFIQ